MPKVAFLDLSRQTRALRPEIDRAIDRVLSSGRFILGEEVTAFETAFARWLGMGHAIGVGSGSDAIRLALIASGIGEGDEVITVANAGVPTVAAIAAAGAAPVLADVEQTTMTLDASRVAELVSSRTRAIVPVHLYGQCADMTAVMAVADRFGLTVVEDCAQAHGARWRGRPAGTIGRVGCFSFYPTKNLGAIGDGGMIVTNDDEIVRAVGELRSHGERQGRHSVRRSGNSRLDELHAAVLGVKLPHVDGWNERRRAIAQRYLAALEGSALILPVEGADRTHVYHLFVVRSAERDRLRARLADQGIETMIHYDRAAHEHEAWGSLRSRSPRLEASERLSREVLSLPLYPEMRDDEVAHVIEAIRAAL